MEASPAIRARRTGRSSPSDAELRSALDDIGRVGGFQLLTQAFEIADDTLVSDGRVYRFKQMVDKEWMTLWGRSRCRVGYICGPLDGRCGMSGDPWRRSLERVTAFLGARSVPARACAYTKREAGSIKARLHSFK